MTLKVGMQHRVFEYYQFYSNDAPGLTLTYFTARSNLVPYAFVWKKGKTMDFSETIVVYDIKVNRCSLLNENMKLYEFQRWRSFIDLGPNLSDSIFLNFFSSITSRLIEAKFHEGHMTKMATMPIYGKNLQKSSLEPQGRWPWNLVCSIEYYQVCSNDGPGLTLTYFTAN